MKNGDRCISARRDGIGDIKGGEVLGGGSIIGDSSGDESFSGPAEFGVGDCAALAFPLKSLDVRERDRERERRLDRVLGPGDVTLASSGGAVSPLSSGG